MSPSPLKPSKLAYITNPFLNGVLASPLHQPEADVPKLNRYAFERCIQLVNATASRGQSATLLLFGESGAGKTHLLSRLCRRLEGGEDLVIPLRLQTSPGVIWRFVRANLAAALLRRSPSGEIPLQTLFGPRRGELEKLDDPGLTLAIKQLLAGEHVRESAAWLRGEDLSVSALRRSHLPPHPAEEEDREERAYQVLRELAALSLLARFVFCLDQVEALQLHAEDAAGIVALEKLLTTLQQTLQNAVIIFCVQTPFLDRMKAALPEAQLERLLANRCGLQSLTWEQAGDLITARLKTQPEIAALRPQAASPLWPIDLEKLKPVFAPAGSCSARKLLDRCGQIYDEVAHGLAPRLQPPGDDLSRMYEERLRLRSARRSDLILHDALPRFFSALGIPLHPPVAAFSAPFDLVLRHDQGAFACAFCNQREGEALARRFRKIAARWDTNQIPRLFLLRDARLGIEAADLAARGALEQLRQRGAAFVPVSPEALAALAAIRSLLASAHSGQLSHAAQPITLTALEKWMASSLPLPLAELLDYFLGVAPSLSALAPALTALLNEHKILSIPQAARHLKVSLTEVADCAHQNPNQFAVLEGPGPVLFQPVRQLLSR